MLENLIQLLTPRGLACLFVYCGKTGRGNPAPEASQSFKLKDDSGIPVWGLLWFTRGRRAQSRRGQALCARVSVTPRGWAGL